MYLALRVAGADGELIRSLSVNFDLVYIRLVQIPNMDDVRGAPVAQSPSR